MTTSRTASDPLTLLTLLIVVLAVVAASTGLFWPSEAPLSTTTSIWDKSVALYGRGLYRLDTLFVGAGARGTDAVTLGLALPFLIAALILRHRGARHGSLLLSGALAWFLYVYASLALGAVTHNEAFLVYVALFSASLFALALALREAHSVLAALDFGRLPRRGLAALLIGSGLLTLMVWLGPIVSAQVAGHPPARIGIYTGRVTDALDLGIITPATVLAGLLILRRQPVGLTIALPLFVLEAFLLPMIVAQTVSQHRAGVAFSTAEWIGPVGGFVVLAGLSLWALVSILRGVPTARSHAPARLHSALHPTP